MPGGTSDPYQRLLDQKIIAGLPLGQFYTELDDHYLICATETCTKADMDRLVKEVSS
jgi:glycine dehydrogenase subunit 1